MLLFQKEIVSCIFSPKLKSISVQNFTYRDVQQYYLPKVISVVHGVYKVFRLHKVYAPQPYVTL